MTQIIIQQGKWVTAHTITTEQAKQIRKLINSETTTLPIDVYKAVCSYFQVQNLDARDKRNTDIYYRQVYCYLSDQETTALAKDIASLIGGISRFMVIKATKRIKGFIDVDNTVKEHITEIKKLIYKIKFSKNVPSNFI